MISMSISPRFCETDALGHINNTAFGPWFEAGRIAYLGAVQRELGGQHPTWVVVSIQMDFGDETFFGRDVQLEVYPTAVGNTSITLGCRMTQDGRLTVQAKGVLVYLDDERKKSRIPDEIRALLERDLQTQ